MIFLIKFVVFSLFSVCICKPLAEQNDCDSLFPSYKSMLDDSAKVRKLVACGEKIILVREFEKWKGDIEQIDDVCVIGVRV